MNRIKAIAILLYTIKCAMGKILLQEVYNKCIVRSEILGFLDIKFCNAQCKDVEFYNELFEQVTDLSSLEKHFIFPTSLYEFVNEEHRERVNGIDHFILSGCMKKANIQPNSPTHFVRVFSFVSNLAVFFRSKLEFFKEKPLLELESVDLQEIFNESLESLEELESVVQVGSGFLENEKLQNENGKSLQEFKIKLEELNNEIFDIQQRIKAISEKFRVDFNAAIAHNFHQRKIIPNYIKV
jgi:hypothetical protein